MRGLIRLNRAFSSAPGVRFGSMNGSLSCRVEQLSSAKPEAIYDVLMDVERWAEFMPTVSAAAWERGGEPELYARTDRRGPPTISPRLRGVAPLVHAAQGLPGRYPDSRGSERVPHRLDGDVRVAHPPEEIGEVET